MEEMDASGTFKISWMGTSERQPLEEMDLLGTFESSCLAGASGAAAADLAGDDEQAIIRYPFSLTLAEYSPPAGQPNKRGGSPPVGENKKRIKSNTDGGDKFSNEEKCLLFSYGSGGAAGGNSRDTSASREIVQQKSMFKIDKAKHKVFLSHSGEQKGFVELLCKDLEARGHLFPFFDARQHSLPAGKDYEPLIIEAAQLCRVAVIVLSEKFLCSTWPMIELTQFYAAQQVVNKHLNMLPLFYKLGVEELDLDDRAIEDKWIPIWKELAKADRRIDVEKCSAAVRKLYKTGGLDFSKYGKSEELYRREIVECIFRLSSPDLLYGSAREMVGYDRTCEKVSSRFANDGSAGPSVLGLYGTSGRGKTMLCKALCDQFTPEFLGRVCYLDLGEITTIVKEEMMLKRPKLKLKRVKLMLEKLCGFQSDQLVRVTDDRQGLKLLRVHVHREPVFVALDNVTGDVFSLREARRYLQVRFHPKSRILITSRSVVNVRDLLPGSQFCMAIPRLTVEEAGEIFLRSAAPMRSISGLTDEERRIVGLCIQQCLVEADGDEEKQLSIESDVWGRIYHPLALSALGDFFHRLSSNSHILRWKDHLKTRKDLIKDVLSHPNVIERMIGLQFSILYPSDQLLFLDIALYSRSFGLSERLKGSSKRRIRSRWLEWVSELHGVTAAVMERRLQDLTRSGMINYDDTCFDEESGEFTIPVPSLYKKFAEWYATEHGLKGLKKNSWGVCLSSGAAQNRHSSLSDLVRLRVFHLSRSSARLVPSKTMQELHNLEVLHLHWCPNLTELDLHGLDSLRHLELYELEKLVTVTLSGSSGADEDLGIYESLQSVLLEDLESLTHGPDLRSCRSLHWLRVGCCPKLANLEQISECRDLKELELVDLFPQQGASIPIVESLPSLQCFHLTTIVDVDLCGVIYEVEGREGWDQLENRVALMLGELLRHLRSLRVDDSDNTSDPFDAVRIEWSRRGSSKVMDDLMVQDSSGIHWIHERGDQECTFSPVLDYWF
ncbi:hypothetical protein M758_9G055500 [Ceratodon purpureus]|nr:hypothetical protein M758_9G055500 [Ceratodon purpureus]